MQTNVFRRCFSLLVCCAGLLWHSAALAVPSYARQTGEACVACHVSFPELTPFGRLFKLSGYTLGTRQLFPVAGMAIASITRTGSTQGNDAAFPKNNQFAVESGSLFIAGKVTDNLGLFSQWTYNNLHPSTLPDGSTRLGGQVTVDNNDIRLADHIAKSDLDLIYGLTLNNNPTVQDVWNSTPAFSYPYQNSNVAGTWGNTPPSPLIAGGLAQQVAGLSAYAFLNKHWYVELGGYQAAEGMFSVLSQNVDIGNRLQGTNPYWRFAYSTDWGANSLSLGMFGLDARINTDSTDSGSPTDHTRDQGFDMQYQYLSDPTSISAQLSWIKENTDWDASHLNVDRAFANSNLNSYRAKVSYWYQHKYGVTLGYFNVQGSSDPLQYTNSASGSPNSNGYVAEFNYMIRPYWRLGLQYTGYLKYMGATNNYDGNGRNARDNNIAYLYTWVAF